MNNFKPYFTDASNRIENGFMKLEKTYAILMDTCSPDDPDAGKHVTFIHECLNSIDEYATEITSAISAISTALELFASIDEIKENASFIFYLNESINRFNKYVPLYRRYDKIREPLKDKVDIA